MQIRFLTLLFLSSFFYGCATSTIDPRVLESEVINEVEEEALIEEEDLVEEVPSADIVEEELPVADPEVEIVTPPELEEVEVPDEIEALTPPTEATRPKDVPPASKEEKQKPKVIQMMKDDLQKASDFIEKMIDASNLPKLR